MSISLVLEKFAIIAVGLYLSLVLMAIVWIYFKILLHVFKGWICEVKGWIRWLRRKYKTDGK